VVRVRALGGLSLVSRTVAKRVVDTDPLDDQDLVLEVDVTLGV
jgi:hypothetical protein